MTNDELQELIDAVDLASAYFASEQQDTLKAVSNLLVDLPDDVVAKLVVRYPEAGED